VPIRRRPPSVALLGLTVLLLACGAGEPTPPKSTSPATPVSATPEPSTEPEPTPEPTPEPPPEPAPIVLISIDTLRSDRLPAYGYGGVETPAIDRLAADGVVFDRAYAHSPLTLPSHASILTGLLPPAHGVRDNVGYRLDPAAVPYLPRRLREAGYATGGAVSAYVLRGEGGFADGFDRYDDAIERRDRAGVGGLQRPGEEALERILPWLRERGGEPFFLFLHLFEPHTPYRPPEPFASRYPDPYDGEVAAADRVVGELLAELDRLGLYRRSAILLLSDHGEGLGDHGEDEHGLLLYRESVQVPLILKLPGGRAAGRRVAEPAQLVDVAPTILELAGLEPSAEGAGRSLLGALRGEPAEDPRPVYAETYFPRLHFGWSELTSLVSGRWHFIHGPDPELYDLVADPAEERNLLRDERRVARELRDALAELERELEPPAPVDEEERRKLAALGYVGTVGGEAEGPLPDPKSRLHTVADLKEGLRAYSAGELETAVASLRRAVAENPRSLDGWEYLGRSFAELRRPAEAVAAFERALELADGRAAHLAVSTALLLIEGGRIEPALALLRREVPKTAEDFSLRLLEARTLVLAGRTDEALERAEELVQEAPENADAVYLRGAVRIGRRDLEGAEKDLRRALDLAPDHTAAMSDLALILQHRGAVAEAKELYRRILELRPGDRGAREGLARLGG